MLGAMRKHSKSFIIYLLFAMIIIVFVFTFNTGAGRGGGCTPEDVPVYAKVGSHDITRDNLVMGMGLLPNFLRTPGGMAFALASGVDLQALYRSDLEELTPEQANAIMQLMEMIYLASDEADRLGFSVGDKELARAMYPESFYEEKEVEDEDGIPVTRKIFKQKEFNNWVVYGLNSSPQEYENFVGRVLLAFKLQAFLSGVVKVEPAEAELAARAKNAKVNLAYVEFRPQLFAGMVELSDEAVATYAAEHAEQIQAWYDSHPTQFHADAGYQVAGIFVAGNPAEVKEGENKALPTPEQMETAKKKAQTIVDRISGKQELFEGGQLPLAVKPPEEGGTLTIDSKDLEIPEEPLARFKEVAKRESDHAETKDRSGLFLGWQTRGDLAQPPLGEPVAEAVEKAAKDEMVGPVEVPEGYWVLYVTDLREKKDMSLDEAKLDIARRLMQEEKAPEVAQEQAKALLEAVKKTEGNDLEAALAELRKPLEEKMEGNIALALLQVRETGKFNLATPNFSIPGIGTYEDLFKAAFGMSVDAPLADQVYVHPETNRAFVVKLIEKEMPEAQVDAADIEQEKENLAFSRSVPYFEAWLKNLRQQAMEKGKMERTEDFQAFLTYLQTRQLEAEAAAAKQASAQ